MPVFLHISYILHLHLKHMLFPQARLMDEAVWVVSHAYPGWEPCQDLLWSWKILDDLVKIFILEGSCQDLGKLRPLKDLAKILPCKIVKNLAKIIPLQTEFPVFWEFLGILKNSQLCKWPLQTEFPVFWEFLGIPRNS